MATLHIVDKQEIVRFNLMRENKKGKQFTLTEIKAPLKQMGYCSSGLFIKSITSKVNPPIVRISRGKYTFSKEPVHIDRLKLVWKIYQNRNKDAKAKCLNTHRVGILSDKISSIGEEDILKAINLLKKVGYRVLKQEIKWIEL